ncbi:hypothetical protein KUL49_16870 [Alteromonas sp. KUL49]|nr:hypothetical protein KUL49_16870 [Alteromonas sp. KUL49]
MGHNTASVSVYVDEAASDAAYGARHEQCLRKKVFCDNLIPSYTSKIRMLRPFLKECKNIVNKVNKA